MPELPDHQLDHNGIIEKTQPRDMVGNQVFRLGEISECIQYPASLRLRQPPLLVDHHIDHGFEPAQPRQDEFRHVCRFHFVEQGTGRVQDIVMRHVLRGIASLAHNQLEVLEVRLAQFKSDFQRH